MTGLSVLVACETSGAVRDAFLELGHDAYSCDMLPADTKTDRHIVGDAVEVIASRNWDIVIAHPPCTHLCVSGSRWFAEKQKDGRQQEGIDLFMAIVGACDGYARCWSIENPVGIMGGIYRKPDQIIQPWQFGHGETKATCLWTKGLPNLQPTNIVDGRNDRIHRMAPGPDRWKERSKTYKGIAAAMAEQYSSAAMGHHGGIFGAFLDVRGNQ